MLKMGMEEELSCIWEGKVRKKNKCFQLIMLIQPTGSGSGAENNAGTANLGDSY